MFATPSILDPYLLNTTGRVGYSILDGKAIRSPRINMGENTAFFICVGQSLFANTVNAQYVPTHASKIDQLSVFDGGCYNCVDPVIGPDGSTPIGGTFFGQLADKLITDGFYQRVVFLPCAVGGTLVSRWQPGGDLNHRLVAAGTRAYASNFNVTAYLYQQGEADNAAATPQANYQASLNYMISGERAAGRNAPWLIAKSTFAGGEVSAAIQAAQVAVRNGVDILAGADTDTLGVGVRHDGTHLTALGAMQAAALWATAIVAAL